MSRKITTANTTVKRSHRKRAAHEAQRSKRDSIREKAQVHQMAYRKDRHRRYFSRRDREAIQNQALIERLGERIATGFQQAITWLTRLLAFPFHRWLGHPKATPPPPEVAPPSNDYPPPRSAESYEAAVARLASGMAYRKRDILSQGERAFWHPLQQAVGRRYLILCKVRLYDLAAVPANHPGEYRAFQQLARFHVDFVLCDPRTTTPLLAIELDDRSHRQRTTIKRDQYKDAVLRAARLPVYRVRCKQAYAPHEISVKIARMVERG